MGSNCTKEVGRSEGDLDKTSRATTEDWSHGKSSCESSCASCDASARPSVGFPAKPPSRPIADGDVIAVVQDDLDRATNAATKLNQWPAGEFTFVKTLQDAARNQGRVDLMQRKDTQTEYAVKRMPLTWVGESAEHFNTKYPKSLERPWFDIGVLAHLTAIGFPYACKLHSVYTDNQHMFVVQELATEGDLFSWCDLEHRLGRAREQVMMPMVSQIFTAVRLLHDFDIAHRDLSLENILLTKPAEGSDVRIRLIDFGMATLGRRCNTKEVCGKLSYQAPEMHLGTYDTFPADCFALGVTLFGMAAQDYPWMSTKKGACQLFDYINAYGLRTFLSRRKLRKGNGEHLGDILSSELVDVVEGLVERDPTKRFTLGESCYSREAPLGRSCLSVWDCEWLRGLYRNSVS